MSFCIYIFALDYYRVFFVPNPCDITVNLCFQIGADNPNLQKVLDAFDSIKAKVTKNVFVLHNFFFVKYYFELTHIFG